jgi:arylsulfatase A-like enzyme/Tfp pilus assembly protein PilF
MLRSEWPLLACVALAACGCRSRQDVGPYPNAPVVLISVDTLRADRLGLYGFSTGSTPAIDALGREGVVFEDVYSPCPQTLPAHVSLMTGLLPPRHGVRDNIGFTLKPGPRTLAERFKAAGLATGASVSAYVLRSQTGIGRGFDVFDDRLEIAGAAESLGSVQRDGAVAVESLGRWIEEQGGRRFFAFLHLYEPHTPYAPPERHRRFAHPYDGDVAYADELVGRFLDRLRAKGILDRAVVAFTSDHGEGLNDHGEEEHGIFLYREAVHVPLVLRLPGAMRAGTRVKGTVALADVAPTLLDLAGMPQDGIDAVSLRPAVAAGRAEPRPVYSETLFPRYHYGWSELYAVTEARYRYIRAPRPELFDVARDPAEKENVIASSAAAADKMKAWLERQVDLGKVAPPEAVSPEVLEKLQALGYVGAPSAAATASATDLPDPKDKIDAVEGLNEALRLRSENRLDDAVVRLRALLADNPRMVDASEKLGASLFDLGRSREAVAVLERALEVDPARSGTHLALARIHGLEGRLDRAARHAEIASEGNPGLGFEVLAQIMMDRGELGRAAELARRSLQADDERVMSHFILGVVAQKQRRCEDALRSFRRAEELLRLHEQTIVRNLHANMGDCLARMGREAEAETAFLAEIETLPQSREARVGLATLYRSQGRDGAARSVLGDLIAADPRPNADLYWTVVRTFAVLGDTEAARRWAAEGRARFPSDPRFRQASPLPLGEGKG